MQYICKAFLCFANNDRRAVLGPSIVIKINTRQVAIRLAIVGNLIDIRYFLQQLAFHYQRTMLTYPRQDSYLGVINLSLLYESRQTLYLVTLGRINTWRSRADGTSGYDIHIFPPNGFSRLKFTVS